MSAVQAPRRPAGEAVAGQTLLKVDRLSVRFGGVWALRDVSFQVERGQVVGLIGPNGAGKTTLFNCLSGLYRPTSGSILFEGEQIVGLPPYHMAAKGLGRTFQNLALFDSLTVLENVMLGAHSRIEGGFFAYAMKLPATARRERATLQRAMELCEFVGLAGFTDRPVADLPFGLKKRVEFARALASDPKLLLLDEPAVGLNHQELSDLGDRIQRVSRDMGITVLLVEHHMSLLMRVSDHVVVLNFGERIAEGTPAEVQRNQQVLDAYLGTSGDEQPS
ncbi:MAG TPA: ABC transporter ATP-binding protein [Ramlibacter sp.]